MVPHIKVWAETINAGDKVRVFFKDNGVGIEKEAHETIFGIFQRVSKNYEGSGIGPRHRQKKGPSESGETRRVGNPSPAKAKGTFLLVRLKNL